MADEAAKGRDAFARRSWREARDLLAACEAADADDLERLAVATHLLGLDRESAQAWERAHLGHAQAGDRERAAGCAFWLALALMLRGEHAPAAGWLARAERLVDDAADEADGGSGDDSAVRGLLLVPRFLGALEQGDHTTARSLADDLLDRGRRLAHDDLLTFGLLTLGEVTFAAGETRRAMTSFDEAMVAVATGTVSPIAAGIVYSAVIEACMDACDLRRASEWTNALADWCESQPDLVPFRGQCLVHRSQVLQAHGSWPEATREAEQAQARLAQLGHPAVGLALYQLGELHRLRGDFAAAEQAYRAAGEQGRDPMPGLALLRLAEGRIDAAVAGVRRMVDEGTHRLDRPTRLAAVVEVLLAGGDLEGARAASEELAASSAASDAVLLRAMADHAAGSVALAAGDAAGALVPLRRACAAWRALGVPYDAARACVRIAQACRALGDDDGATLELDAAGTTFARLGAVSDVAAVARLAAPGRPSPTTSGTSLTDREREVLRLVATGRTNREIADALVISVHTVARHLQNIFLKLGLSSRAAATAYAYEHDLITGSRSS